MTEASSVPIQLGSTEFWHRLREDPSRLCYEICLIDLTRLDITLAQHPALVAWVNAQHETARINEARAKLEVTKERARAVLRARAARAEGDPQSVVAANAKLDTEVEEKERLWLAWQTQRGVLKALMEALDDRESLLVQLSVRNRGEHRVYS